MGAVRLESLTYGLAVKRTTIDLRELADRATVVAILVILLRGFAVGGYVVTTGSMAPAVLGRHKDVNCPSCGLRFSVGAPWTDTATCSNCGQGGIELAGRPILPGDQLLAWKHAFDTVSPRRWEQVVLQNPTDSPVPYLKRVVGLPGESVQIVDGDLVADGAICGKSLDQQRAMRIAIFYDRYRPTGNEQDVTGWNDDGVPPAWTRTSNGFRASPANATAIGPAWLTFHRRGPRGRSNTVKELLLTDFNGYNGDESEASPIAVRDLMIDCCVRCGSATGESLFELPDGIHPVRLTIRLDDRTAGIRFGSASSAVTSVPIPDAVDLRSFRLEFSTFDRRVLVAIDGSPLVPPIALPVSQTRPLPSSVRIGAVRADVEITELKLFRDVYYTAGSGRHAVDAPVRLGEKEYFLLGDNSPVSNDARNWPQPATHLDRLMGKPLFVYWPSRSVDLRWLRAGAAIRIPDLPAIRYIR